MVHHPVAGGDENLRLTIPLDYAHIEDIRGLKSFHETVCLVINLHLVLTITTCLPIAPRRVISTESTRHCLPRDQSTESHVPSSLASLQCRFESWCPSRTSNPSHPAEYSKVSPPTISLFAASLSSRRKSRLSFGRPQKSYSFIYRRPTPRVTRSVPQMWPSLFQNAWRKLSQF